MQLYDAALVANKEHAAAYHGWGLLEKREGNFKKARDIWMRVTFLLNSSSHSAHNINVTLDEAQDS